MTLKELQRWILKHDEEDFWWVALDGEVSDTVMALPDVSRLSEQFPDQQVTVLHVSKAEDENAEWIIFERMEIKGVRVDAVEAPTNQPISMPSASGAEVASLKEQITSLRAEFESFKAMIDELKEPIDEARKVLDERENFLEIGETALFDKAQKQEVLQTELEQLRDELNRREHYLDEREQTMGRGQAAG